MGTARNYALTAGLISVVSILNFLAFLPDGNSATITVCDIDCHYASIQTAIDNAVAGDTIHIFSGTYTEAGIMVDRDLILTGDGAESTIVQAAVAEAAATDRVFHIAPGVTATLEHMTIRNGYPAGFGGGILNQGTLLTVENCIVSHNRNHGATGQRGGGIYSTGSLWVDNSTICDNTGDSNENDGGGIFFNDAGSDLVIANSTISNNTDWNSGGGVFVYDANSATITNSTISGNAAGNGGAGGGIYNAASLDISFSTITGNATTASYGGIYNSGSIYLKNSIVADNTDNGTFPDLGGGTFNSMGGNLIGDNTGSVAAFNDGLPNARGDFVGTGASAIDPLVDMLADNGGPTDTHALQAGSPAIDAANDCTDVNGVTVTTDQRGYTRPPSNCDSGAYDTDAEEPPEEDDDDGNKIYISCFITDIFD